MKHFIIAGLLIVAGLVSFSCENEPFTLVRATGAITVFDDRNINMQYEFLSAWLTFKNEANIENIAVIYVAHDSSELYWTVAEDSWKQVTNNSNDILLVRLRMHDLSPMPRGPYRIISKSYGGDESIVQLFISPRLTLDVENLPQVVNDSQRVITSSFTLNYIFGIDQNEFPYNVRQTSTPLIIGDSIHNAYDQMYFYAPFERQGGYLSGPY